MNKKASAVAFVLALSVSVMAGASFVSLVEANPFWWYETVPPDEYTEAPVISVLSPANNTMFNEDNVYLSFKVDVGESKTAVDTVLLIVSYETDWQHDNIDRFAPWSDPYPFVHEVNLTAIPEGNHSITFQAIERGAYKNARAFNIDSSETIFFTIDTNPETEIPEFLSLTPLLLILALLAVILAVYKRRMGKTPNHN